MVEHTTENRGVGSPILPPGTLLIQAMTTFFLVRHGETHWNVEERWQGHQDSSLTERGIQQVEELAKRIVKFPLDVAYSSDLPRAVHTAKILTKNLQIELHTAALLRERKAGPVDGTTEADRKLKPEIHTPMHAYLQLASIDKWDKKPFPDFESNQEVAERFEAELLRLGEKHPGQHVLVVAHGGNIRNFLAHIGYIPKETVDRTKIKNAHVAVVILKDGIFTVAHEDCIAPK